MSHSENGRECPGCRSAYIFKVGIKTTNAGVLPYLLTCGHSLCSFCVKHTSHSQSAIICPVCKAHSDLPQSTSLVNKYMIGQLLFKNQESQKIENRESPQITIVRCTECRQNVAKSAASKCNSCGVLCKRCVELVHNRKADGDQKSHQVISLDLDAYICDEHKRGREYYCSDHQQFLCSDCAIYYHGGHNITDLKQWKSENAKSLKESVDKAKMVLVSTSNSIKYLRKTTQTLEDVAKHHALHLEEEFEHYHALLQLREEQLLQQIRKDTKDKVERMDKMITDLERTKNEVKQLILEERSILEDSTVESNRKLLQLLDIDKTECYLEPLKDETLEIVHKCTNPDKSFIDCLQNCGCLPSSNAIGPIVLKSLPDNPSDIISSTSMENVLFVEAERDVKVVPKKSPTRALNVQPAGVSLSPVSTRPSKRSTNRNLKTIKYEDVKVVHIVSPHEFYVRRAADFEMFRKLMTELDTWGSNLADDELILENVEIAQLVMLHSDEHGWARGRVLSTKETEPVESDLGDDLALTANSVECFLLDIGAIERKDLTKLRETPQEYLSLPQFAVKCSLHKIDPINQVLGWSVEAIDMFRNYVLNEDVRMNVYEICNGTLSVDLGRIECDESHYVPISVLEALIFLELATFSCPLNQRTEALRLNRKFLEVSLSLRMPNSVHVCYCCSPSEFFVQPYDDKLHLYEVMMDDIENLHLDQTDPLSGPRKGMPCIAKFTDGVWYRAEVLSLEKGSSIRVRYVDYGNEHVLSYKDVRCIPDRFLELPKLARKCCLADVKPIGDTWSQEVLDSFTEQFDQKDCTMWLESELKSVSYVTLYYRCGEEVIRVNSKLVADKLCISTGPASLKGEVVEKQPNVSTVKNPYSGSSITNDCPSDNLVQRMVKIVYAESPGAIYVRFADYEPFYISLQEDLKLSCDEKSDKPAEEPIDEVSHWKVSDMCAFLDQISHSWNRGKILDITDGRAKVFAIDIGSVHLVDVRKLQSVPDALNDVPTSLVKCHLYGIAPAGGISWASLSITHLHELITKNNIYLTKMGDEFNGSLPVELISQEKHVGGALEPVKTINISFSEYLVDKGVVLPLKRAIRQTGRPLSPKDAVVSKRLCEETTELSSQIGRVALLRHDEQSMTRPDNIKWKQSDVKFQKRQKVNVRVSSVNDGGEICFQIFENEDGCKWTALMKILGDMDENVLDCSPCLSYKVGDGCLAQFGLDRKWHRAEINDVFSGGITVTFIDYGTIRDLSLNEVRFNVSDPDLLDIPRLGYYCTLHGIAPMNDFWGMKTLEWLSGIIKDVDCDLIVIVPEVDGERMKVDLMVSDGNKVQDLMVKLNHARRCPTFNRRKKKSKGLACLNGLPSNFRCTKKARIRLPLSVIVGLDVLRFVAPNQFYATYSRDTCETAGLNESINAQLDEFADLMSSMNDKASKWPRVLNFEKGMFCCGLSETRKEWVRVRVVSVNGEDKEVEVSLVDFGCIEKMAVDCIRSMPEDFIKFPDQAELYQLHQVVSETDDWSPAAISALETICKNDCLACIKSEVGSPIQVDLFRKESCADGDSEYVLAYQSLIDDSLIKLVRTT